MASAASNKALTRKRILANVQDRKKTDTPDVSAEEDAKTAAQESAAERILCQPVKAARKKRRKPPKGRSVAQITLLGAIVIAGIAAIIVLRNVAEMSGVNWVGD